MNQKDRPADRQTPDGNLGRTPGSPTGTSGRQGDQGSDQGDRDTERQRNRGTQHNEDENDSGLGNRMSFR
jgi:hypothetical protein